MLVKEAITTLKPGRRDIKEKLVCRPAHRVQETRVIQAMLDKLQDAIDAHQTAFDAESAKAIKHC